MDEEIISAIAAIEEKQQEMDKKLQSAIEKAASEHWPDDNGKLEDAIIHAASQKTANKGIFDSIKVYSNKRKQPKPITDLSPEEAMAFLMESEQYCRTELPKYFDFSGVLAYAKEAVGVKSLKECTVKGMSPADLDKVNLDMMTNKDGRYGVRPLNRRPQDPEGDRPADLLQRAHLLENSPCPSSEDREKGSRSAESKSVDEVLPERIRCRSTDLTDCRVVKNLRLFGNSFMSDMPFAAVVTSIWTHGARIARMIFPMTLAGGFSLLVGVI